MFGSLLMFMCVTIELIDDDGSIHSQENIISSYFEDVDIFLFEETILITSHSNNFATT
jgi:hypothetical protein